MARPQGGCDKNTLLVLITNPLTDVHWTASQLFLEQAPDKAGTGGLGKVITDVCHVPRHAETQGQARRGCRRQGSVHKIQLSPRKCGSTVNPLVLL